MKHLYNYFKRFLVNPAETETRLPTIRANFRLRICVVKRQTAMARLSHPPGQAAIRTEKDAEMRRRRV